MQDVNLKIIGIFAERMRIPMQNDFEGSMEWKLYDSISDFFTPLRRLTTAVPYKLNQL